MNAQNAETKPTEYALTSEEAQVLEEIMAPAENQARGAIAMIMRLRKLEPPYNWDRAGCKLVKT